MINTKGRKLWNNVKKQNTMHNPLPEKRERPTRAKGHNYVLSRVRTERFKYTFVSCP